MTDHGRSQLLMLLEDGKTINADADSWYTLGLLHGLKGDSRSVPLQILIIIAITDLHHNDWRPLLDDETIHATYWYFKSGGH